MSREIKRFCDNCKNEIETFPDFDRNEPDFCGAACKEIAELKEKVAELEEKKSSAVPKRQRGGRR